eukprot:3141409-Prymnesium_polylepis.1
MRDNHWGQRKRKIRSRSPNRRRADMRRLSRLGSTTNNTGVRNGSTLCAPGRGAQAGSRRTPPRALS